MAKVYFVQEPIRRNFKTGEMERSFDIKPALAYGEIVDCLKSDAFDKQTPAEIIEQLCAALKDITSEDFLVFCGNPTAIAFAAIIVSDYTNGNFKVLHFLKENGTYLPFSFDIEKHIPLKEVAA